MRTSVGRPGALNPGARSRAFNGGETREVRAIDHPVTIVTKRVEPRLLSAARTTRESHIPKQGARDAQDQSIDCACASAGGLDSRHFGHQPISERVSAKSLPDDLSSLPVGRQTSAARWSCAPRGSPLRRERTGVPGNQKSALSAAGTAASFSVANLCAFSAQTLSGHSRSTCR